MEKRDRDRVLAKLEEMNGYLSELAGMLPEEDEYTRDLVKKRACEKTIELAVEAVMDIAAIIVSSEKMGLPQSDGGLIDTLIKKRVITSELGERLKDMKGFRNILIHKYGEINDELAYEFMQRDVGDFEGFEKQVRTYLKLPE